MSGDVIKGLFMAYHGLFVYLLIYMARGTCLFTDAMGKPARFAVDQWAISSRKARYLL